MPQISYQENLTIEQRVQRLRNQKQNSQQATAMLLTLHTIKKVRINVSTTAQQLTSSIRRDFGIGAPESESAREFATAVL